MKIKRNINLNLLLLNLFAFFVYGVLASILGWGITIFCAFHSLMILSILQKKSLQIIQIKNINSFVKSVVLFETIFLFLVFLFDCFQTPLFKSFIIFLITVFSIFILFSLFKKTIKLLHNWNRIAIIIELTFSFSLFLILFYSDILPIYPVDGSFTFDSIISSFNFILEYTLFVLVLSISFYLFKYRNFINFAILFSCSASSIVLSAVMSMMYFHLDARVEMHYSILLFTVSLFFYLFRIKRFSVKPLVEMCEENTEKLKLEMLVKSKMYFFIIVSPILIMLLRLFKLIPLNVYFYLNIALIIYIIVNVMFFNKNIRYLIKKQEDAIKSEMHSTIKGKNEEMIRTNAKLQYLNTHDKDTKLSNRSSFIIDVNNLIHNDNTDFSFVSLSALNMSTIRNIYGIKFANKLFNFLIKRLKRVLKANEYIYLLSTDELAVISVNVSNGNSNFFEEFYSQLNYISDLKYKIDEIKVKVNLKVSFARYPEDIASIEELFTVSNLMSFEYVKDSKFSFDLENSKSILKSLIENNKYSIMIKEAIIENEFTLFYQPQFNINTKELIGCEALIRWFKNDKFISPAFFIPIAEKSGLIYDISKWVSLSAVKQMKKWESSIKKGFRIGINISPLILDSDAFLLYFEKIIEENESKFEYFDFEITEYSELSNSPELILRLNRIHENGLSLSIDDFGTGYSSLSYVKTYRVNKIKIAKELIDEIDISNNSIGQNGINSVDEYTNMISGVINMASTLNMKTIAEGVENESQLKLLQNLKCDEIQGYIWGKPMPAENFEQLL